MDPSIDADMKIDHGLMEPEIVQLETEGKMRDTFDAFVTDGHQRFCVQVGGDIEKGSMLEDEFPAGLGQITRQRFGEIAAKAAKSLPSERHMERP